MTSKLLTFILPVVMLAGCNTTSAPETARNTASPSPSSSPVASSEGSTYTLEEVATHKTPEDCWLVLEGNVYDVSGFATKHPGGEAVYMGCGKDATSLFENRPNNKGAHSDRARTLLPNFKIGTLKQ